MPQNSDDAVMSGQEGHPAVGTAWTRFEIEATVAAYERMLQDELRGVRYRKSDVVRDLMYKPMTHYQSALRDAVLARANPRERINEAVTDFGEAPVIGAQSKARATSDVRVEPPSVAGRKRGQRSSVSLTGTAHDALRDLRRRTLGTAGEEWVLDLEREQLSRDGRPDLADLVRWVAREDGDGAGYDILSFSDSGNQRLIEVKTTNYGPLTPFHITRWEVEVSQTNPESYSLYRVHGFARDPRLYVLDGAMDEAARLEPSVFLGLPR
jgi:hypothetical protein